jgi:RING finger and SPRY domain-containing protein 1
VSCKSGGESCRADVYRSVKWHCLRCRAQKESHFLSNDGYGIGDDLFSVSFDGCRKLLWHNAKSMPINLPTWKAGSVCGCFIDLDSKEIIFSLDGAEATVELPEIFNDLR